jgi:hypothetical protein
MQRLIISLAISAVLAGSPALAANEPARVINVTTDSAPGWTPSGELEKTAVRTAQTYLADMDGRRYAEAYTALDPLNRHETTDAFAARVQRFNDLAGPVLERRVVKVTWTKDPAHAPGPGVYVAIDLISRFANIDRHCGYVVLYQPPAGGGFHVMRQEDNFLDNAAAATIAKQQSAAAVDQAWAQASANCPNYSPASPVAAGAAPPPLSETPNSIGYPTVEAAMTDLRSKSGVVFTEQQGWTVAEDRAALTYWSFPPAGNPAYPAAVKRQIVQTSGGVTVEMSVMCGASKAACDDLVRQFQALNARMKASLQSRQ